MVVEDFRAGMVGTCPGCGKLFRVPRTQGEGTPPPRPPRGSAAASPPDAVCALEEVGDEPAPPPRAVPKARPALRASEPELELVEEAPPAPPRSRAPARDAVTRDRPPPRNTHAPDEDEPVLAELVDEDEAGEDEPDRPKRRKKKRRPKSDGGPSLAAVLIGGGVVVLLWVVMTPVAFLYRPVAYAMLVVGCVCGLVSRVAFARVAREELGPIYRLLMWIPFYEVYFFITHVSRMLAPFVFWVCALLFLGGAGVSIAFHRFSSDRPDLESVPAGPAAFDPDVADPKGIDAECLRLLGRRKEEARAWARGPGPRLDPDGPGVVARAEQAYQNGAKEVYVVGLDPDEDGDIIPSLVIVLPDDAPSRKRLFDWYHAFRHDTPDAGQKFLLLPGTGF